MNSFSRPVSRRSFLCRAGCACLGINAIFDSILSHSFAQVPESGLDLSPQAVSLPIQDVLVSPGAGSVTLNAFFSERVQMGVDHHLKMLNYPKLVDYFRNRTNPFAQGEFWGKTVRSACLTYQYKADPQLKKILQDTVTDLLSTQTPDGCISARTYAKQPQSSDLWERKYVLLGLQQYYQIEPDPAVLNAMIKLADYTLKQVGPAPKIRIVDTGWAFEGIESSSILEPIVKLYDLTGYTRYLDFAKYIVEVEGACKRGNIFEAAHQGVMPKDINNNGHPQKSIAKAYESMSCFEGLIEYYRATGNDHWKEAALKYHAAICDREVTIIGSGGGDQPYNLGPGQGEQWNDLAFEQTNPKMTIMMETCVTVTWMKFCYQVLRLTGDSRVADQIEISLYNALVGAQKPTGNFYDYFQKLNGTRNGRVNFSATIDGFPLSCCTANGPMGLALVPFLAVMESATGPVINLYCFETATLPSPAGDVQLQLQSNYPQSGSIKITVTPKLEAATFSLRLRIPQWSVASKLKINDQEVATHPGTYAEIRRQWSSGDLVELELDMHDRVLPAPHGSERGGDHFTALMHGPLVLSRDLRQGGDIHAPANIQKSNDGRLVLKTADSAPYAQVSFEVPTTNGEDFRVIDYASAGNTWDKASEYVTWIPTPLDSPVPTQPFAPSPVAVN